MPPFLRSQNIEPRPRSRGRSESPGGEPSEHVCLMDIKVVPGARNDQIAGLLGSRIKIRVSAPPEGGKANRAACRLVARVLGIKRGGVTVVAGKTSPEKTVRIIGVSENTIRERLNLP